MNLTKAFALLLFAFFFTTHAGCRTSVSIGDLKLASEFEVLQSTSIEAIPVHKGRPETDPEPDLQS